MVGRFNPRSTMSRLMVWLLLIAFSTCLCASTAFSRQRPYDIKTVTHAVKDTDEGGWAGGERYQGQPNVVILDRSSQKKPSYWALLKSVFGLHFGLLSEQIEVTGSKDVNAAGTSGTSSTE